MRAHRIRTNVPAALAVVIGGAPLTRVCLHKNSWPEVQQTRIKAIEAYNKLINPNHRLRLTALKEVAILSFMSLLPPDRVGVVRRLRLGVHRIARKLKLRQAAVASQSERERVADARVEVVAAEVELAHWQVVQRGVAQPFGEAQPGLAT